MIGKSLRQLGETAFFRFRRSTLLAKLILLAAVILWIGTLTLLSVALFGFEVKLYVRILAVFFFVVIFAIVGAVLLGETPAETGGFETGSARKFLWYSFLSFGGMTFGLF